MCGVRLSETAITRGCATPTPLPPITPTPLEGERRIATVILADVKNSTELMEKIGSEAWVTLMNRVFQIMEGEIYRFGGKVDQFRGDGLVAFFGADIAHEDDPERAVLSALCMQRAIKRFAAELHERQGLDLHLRVGVNTGEVIVAGVGNARQHREDTAMGEAVALAARMETAAEAGTVLVSENTFRLAETEFQWQSLGNIPVKGVSQPVGVYRPLAPHPETEGRHELPSAEQVLPPIGRQKEYQTLLVCIQELFEGRGGITLVTGDKGVGKSFLISHARNHFGDDAQRKALSLGDAAPPQKNLLWLRGSCRSYDQSLPYSMWLDLLQRWLGAPPDEPLEAQRARLRQQAEILWGGEVEKYYPYLATFLSLPLEETFSERVRYLDAQGLQRQFFAVIRGWIEALAQREPLIVGFSDLHWGDSSSLELLKYCLPLCDSQPMLWIISYRPERATPVWNFRHYLETEFPHRLTSIDLQPLDEAESRALLHRLIGERALSEPNNLLVLEKAEGNPYYLREIVNTLIAQGDLARHPESGEWGETRALTTLDLPDSLQNLLLARLDRLYPEERRVLQMAAVIGPLFWRNVLHVLVGEINNLQNSLTSLQRQQLIQERSPLPELGTEYAFNSSLVRDVAYESLLSPQRAACHLKIAQFLEDCLCLESWSRYNGLIAYHYRNAGKHDKELLYAHKAAEQARAVYANAEARDHYDRAIELLDQMEAQTDDDDQLFAIRTQRYEILNRRSQIHYLLGNIRQGDADARALLALAQQIADHPAWLIDALLAQPEIHHPEDREELNAGVQMAQEALNLSQQLGDRRREMISLATFGQLKIILRDASWRADGDRALALARALGDQQAEIQILIGIGSAYGMDDLPRSSEYLETALAIAQKTDDKRNEIALLRTIANQVEREGDYYRLLTEYFQEWLLLGLKIGHRLEEGNALMYCGQVQGLYLGDYPEGLALEEEAMKIWEGTNQILFPLLRIAQIQTESGQFTQAEATLARARPIGERNVYDLGRAGLDLVSAILGNAIGDESHSRQALEYAAKTTRMVAENLVSRQYRMAAACEATAAHLRLAELLTSAEEQQYHRQQALETSQTALQLYEQFGFVQIIECVSEEIFFRRSLALQANGHSEQAADFLRRAHAELMRKFALIPTGSPFRKTFIEDIHLHRQIREAYAVLAERKSQ